MSSDSGDKPWWVEQQRRTFTVWFNARVKDVDVGGTTKPINDIQTDLDDGVQLLRLMKSLYNLNPPMGLNLKPRNIFEKKENLVTALKLAEQAGVKAPLTKESNFVEHDLRMILGFTWSVIVHYNTTKFQGPAPPITSSPSKRPPPSSPGERPSMASSGRGNALKDVLLQYCRNCLEGTNIPMDNFTRHWSDGRAFLGLLHHHDNEIVPDFDERCAEPVTDIDQRKRNLEDAFAAAERIGAPRLLLVDDVAGPEDPDEHSVMTYVAELHSAFETDKAHRERERAAAEERAKNQAMLDRTEAELEAAKARHVESSRRIASTEKMAQDAREKLSEKEKENEQLRKELEKEKEKNKKLEKELEDERKKPRVDPAEKEGLEKELAEEKDKNDKLNKSLEDKDKEIEKLRKELEEEKAKNEKLRKELEEERNKPKEEPKKEEEKPEEPKKEEEKPEEPKKEEEDKTMFRAAVLLNLALASCLSGAPHIILGAIALALAACDMFPQAGDAVNDFVPRENHSLIAMGNIVACLAALLIF